LSTIQKLQVGLKGRQWRKSYTIHSIRRYTAWT